MAGWTPEEIKAHNERVKVNQSLVCSEKACEDFRHYASVRCLRHTREIAEKRRNAALKASETRRERYPERFYAPGEPRPANWQAISQNIVRRAKEAGILPDLKCGEYECVDCAGVATEYDHRDYARPLDVEPVCRSCNHKRGKAEIPSADRFRFKKLAPDAGAVTRAA